MPVQKDFKKLVRGRMAKTGESYTAARAQFRSGTDAAPALKPMRYSTTAALVRALARAGMTFSEPMLFGVGGGIGAAYFVFEFAERDFTSLYVGGRINEFILKGDFAETACRRLGVLKKVHQTAGAKGAETQLRAVLDEGKAPVLTVDQASLSWFNLPKEWIGMAPFTIMAALENGEPVLYDKAPQPHPMSWAELSTVRSRIRSAKNRMLVIEKPAKPIELPKTILEGIAITCRGMLEPPIKNFGLAALEKWAALITNTKDKRGWPRMFTGEKLASALKWLKHWVEVDTGGGNYRALYADFLDEAASALKRPRLRDVAKQYRALAAQWTALTELRELELLHNAVLKLAADEKAAVMALQSAATP